MRVCVCLCVCLCVCVCVYVYVSVVNKSPNLLFFFLQRQRTPLHCAAMCYTLACAQACCKLLVELGADANLRDDVSMLVFHLFFLFAFHADEYLQ